MYSFTTRSAMEHYRDDDDDDRAVMLAARALLNLSPSSKRHRTEGEEHTGAVSMPPRAFKPVFVDVPPLISCSESSGSSDASDEGNHSDVDVDDEWNDRPSAGNHQEEEQQEQQENYAFFQGIVSLALDDDVESLSPLHCFMRRYCVEAFSATEEDVASPRHGKSSTGRVTIGQVGIRCIHCKYRAVGHRQERAVCFPSSLKNIYHSIETWQRRHSVVCKDIPVWIKRSMMELMHKSRSGAGGRRQYWEESAKRLGMSNTEQGIRFIRAPGMMPLDNGPGVEGPVAKRRHVPSISVVRPEDRDLITRSLFLLLDQMEACHFSEEDRVGGRSKNKDCPVGFPGMQCKHCGGKAGFGRYFPSNLRALTSANSDRNIFNHVSKCRRCPREVRDQLTLLQYEQQHFKNRRGSRKLFFQRVWERLHGEFVDSESDS